MCKEHCFAHHCKRYFDGFSQEEINEFTKKHPELVCFFTKDNANQQNDIPIHKKVILKKIEVGQDLHDDLIEALQNAVNETMEKDEDPEDNYEDSLIAGIKEDIGVIKERLAKLYEKLAALNELNDL